MLEIKVRFWDEVNKKFWFGGQEGESDGAETFQTWFDNGVLKGFMYEEVSYGFLPIDDVKHRDLITSQWTCLKDKNGKEIYEGDIVRFHYKTGVYKIGTVVWNDLFGSWDIDCSDFVSYKSLGQYKSVSEVIGNIYENPELLEGC